MDYRNLAIAGWAIGVLGVAVGAVGVLYGWATMGPEAITGGIRLTLAHARRLWSRILRSK